MESKGRLYRIGWGRRVVNTKADRRMQEWLRRGALHSIFTSDSIDDAGSKKNKYDFNCLKRALNNAMGTPERADRGRLQPSGRGYVGE